MARTSVSGSFASVDVSGLRSFAKDLIRADPLLGRTFRARLKEAGELVAVEARHRAGFSKRIPGSVKATVAGVSVKVRAGGAQAPNAAPIENHGKGFVRHPVFGDREAWTAKNSHPAFLAPALDAKADDVVEALAVAVDETLADIGFR